MRAVRDSDAGLPGGISEREPPDPIPNSEVKLLSADDSVGSPHVKVGHRQVPKKEKPRGSPAPGFFFASGQRVRGLVNCLSDDAVHELEELHLQRLFPAPAERLPSEGDIDPLGLGG